MVTDGGEIPMNIMTDKFRSHAQRWHADSPFYDYRGRANVIGYLLDRHGAAAVLRHKPRLRRILNDIEGLCPVE